MAAKRTKYGIVGEKDIDKGLTTDVYFLRAEEILKKRKINPNVVADVTTSGGDWGVLSGIWDVAALLEGKNINVYAMEEGSIFYPLEPVMFIEGEYLEFARYETGLLGFICHQSGIASKAARIRLAAGDVPVMSFGTRRQHPALAAVIERSAYIGGMDGVSNVAAAEQLGLDAMGTMPHSLIICMQDQAEAFRAFDEIVDKNVPRVCLCDTYYDEKEEVLLAVDALGKKLDSVRLDTPSSRRGDMRKIIHEVRWELDIRGYDNIGIFVSGGVDVDEIIRLRDLVDGFGVGTSVASAATIDFALDIVEIKGKPCAKRGKYGGRKQVYRNPETLEGEIAPWNSEAPNGMKEMLTPLIQDGEIVREMKSLNETRDYVLQQLEILADREGI